MKIAFIGLGTMGLPMARCLCAAGHQVRGWDVSPAALETFGATATSLAELSVKRPESLEVSPCCPWRHRCAR